MLNKYMNHALNLLNDNQKDVPIAAIIVKNGEIIASAINKREANKSVISHAEILAINEANQKLSSWRLNDCDMYVTLEPCPMCAWAIINSQIKNLYFGAWDLRYGAMGGRLDLSKIANSKIKVYGGIMEDECNLIIKKYFEKLRLKNEK